MNMEEALKYIHDVSWLGTIPGLERELELLDRIGNPHRGMKYIHVAGTNGKGSTAAMLASILNKAGYRTGLYTSPYIIRFNERIQVDGEQIPDADVCELTEYIQPHAEAMADHPSEFEIVTAIGFDGRHGGEDRADEVRRGQAGLPLRHVPAEALGGGGV